MKYNITYSCGHEEVVQLFGKGTEREKKIDYYQTRGICKACWMEQKAIEMSLKNDEIEMPYRQYKQEYASCKTKPGSWNPETKTIVVYMSKKEAV